MTTGGVTVVSSNGYYESDDRVFVLHEGCWEEARVVEPGQPSDAVKVKHDGIVGGEYERDVLFVRRVRSDFVESYRYEHVRPTTRQPVGVRPGASPPGPTSHVGWGTLRPLAGCASVAGGGSIDRGGSAAWGRRT